MIAHMRPKRDADIWICPAHEVILIGTDGFKVSEICTVGTLVQYFASHYTCLAANTPGRIDEHTVLFFRHDIPLCLLYFDHDVVESAICLRVVFLSRTQGKMA